MYTPSDELNTAVQKLVDLRNSGALSESEFQMAKQRLMCGVTPSQHELSSVTEREDAKLIHQLQLLNIILPVVSLWIPVIYWVLRRNKSKFVDANGKEATNWIISYVIYMAISAFFTTILIGFIPLAIFWLLGIIFPILAGKKASQGKVWHYPLAIRFLK